MDTGSHRYFIINKPFNIVSQFVSTHKVGLLGDIHFDFPEGTHAIGRLDNHSEGLLILTTNKKVTKLLFQGNIPHKRSYLALVKNKLSEESLRQLQNGVVIRVRGGSYYKTIPCEAEIVEDPNAIINLWEGLIQYPPFTWVLITLTEGKFHQVRKMFDVIHHKCKRLIRISIEEIELGHLAPGEVREMNEKDFFEKLRINYER